MIKKIVLVLVSAVVLIAGDFSLNKSKSEVYYEAKKDQFFSTYTILGLNKGLSGTLQKLPKGYRGVLNVNSFSFLTDDKRRDNNVKEHLNSDKHKLIVYRFELHDNVAAGNMTINGVTKEISFPVKMEENDVYLSVEGNITIKYSDFDVETPSNLILSAHDDLVIGAKLHFNK